MWVRLTVVALLLAACSASEPVTSAPDGTLDIGDATLSVEIAETDEQRRRGLMGREELAEDSGMVFLFDAPRKGGFWMKDTLIPLSIAFWDPEGRVLAVLDMEPCRKDPCPIYDPGTPYVGAVETDQGWFSENGVEVGDPVVLHR